MHRTYGTAENRGYDVSGRIEQAGDDADKNENRTKSPRILKRERRQQCEREDPQRLIGDVDRECRPHHHPCDAQATRIGC